MFEIIQLVFGEGSDLAVWQMSARAAVVFALALALIRASGRRSFGQHTPFDACITVLLGAVLSRAVVGASPFLATMAASTVLVFVHRAVALASTRWARFDDLVNGREIEVVRDGQVDPAAMRRALLSQSNLEEAIRQSIGDKKVSDVARATLERDGKVTVLAKD
ncbi:DUF421 domain-containing protein [Variovorax sp. J22P271]|uniref:DUF421 domain-containing protein n=1 Tax=Variovorax davisae TaxID=3053515 RepID=UPI002577C2A5|nr:YetF domain-containing protein [Variovorax sp. J22P271]MDM0032277.1 DUF421 domain-containing protein [Variovorax sp. J22P271]